jgi:hypothetical protein
MYKESDHIHIIAICAALGASVRVEVRILRHVQRPQLNLSLLSFSISIAVKTPSLLMISQTTVSQLFSSYTVQVTTIFYTLSKFI